MKRIAISVGLLASVLATVPASAQYYGGYGPGPRGGYDEDFGPPPRRGPPDDYGRPGRYDYDRPPPPMRRPGLVCVTSRGSCPARQPPGTSCGCSIPGFGIKRGITQ